MRDPVLVKTHPIQVRRNYSPEGPCVPEVVSLRAYEVYCEVFAPQVALITGDCRGGFGIGELVAFLYARSFPRSEWRQRVDEAFAGMRLG